MNPPFDKQAYQGASPSTLCVGCGHDQISRHIIKAFYLAGVNPFRIAKISGIGCSSKTPNYFLKQARGFNTIHGRMASVATGVKMANRDLIVLGVSGDGDTGSIGLGSFLHTVRKNIPMIYIVENNGLYGLTKGQFSPTAGQNTHLKHQELNPLPTMDLCHLALVAGSPFVARSFSGDAKQLTQLLKLALNYKGFAFIDVISPCVAYGNQKDFPHSFSYMRDKKSPLHELDVIIKQSPIKQEIKEGTVEKIPLPDGSVLQLKKLKDHDPSNKNQALKLLEGFLGQEEVATGLIYYKQQKTFLDYKNLSQKPLSRMTDEEIRPSAKILKSLLKNYR